MRLYSKKQQLTKITMAKVPTTWLVVKVSCFALVHHKTPMFLKPIRLGDFIHHPITLEEWLEIMPSGLKLSINLTDLNPKHRSLDSTGMSMVLSKWIITLIQVGCKSRKKVINQLTN